MTSSVRCRHRAGPRLLAATSAAVALQERRRHGKPHRIAIDRFPARREAMIPTREITTSSTSKRPEPPSGETPKIRSMKSTVTSWGEAVRAVRLSRAFCVDEEATRVNLAAFGVFDHLTADAPGRQGKTPAARGRGRS
jgi:hypothetical protein